MTARQVLVLCTLLAVGSVVHAKCTDTSAFGDAQRAVDATVRCDDVASHQVYVKRGTQAIAGLRLSPSCRSRFVKERLKRSVCGRAGYAVCCATSSRHRIANRIVRATKCTSGEVCAEANGFPRNVGEGCTAQGQCVVCPDRGPGVPRQVTFTARTPGSDLDLGWSGTFHNFPVVAGARLAYCLEDCDGTSDTGCVGRGPTGDGTPNGGAFGAPLPVLAAGVPVCVASRFQDAELRSTFDVATGEAQADLDLFADVYLTFNPAEVCPRCLVAGDEEIGSAGKCSAGAANPGASCRVEGIVNVAQGPPEDRHYSLSSRCVPRAEQQVATLDVRVPLTTGTSTLAGPLPCADTQGPQMQDDVCGFGTCSARCTGNACVAVDPQGRCVAFNGGISQLCCSTSSDTSCFPTEGGGAIVRTGAPFGGSPGGAFVATYCVPRTDSSLINAVVGLPGPGALILPVEAVALPEP